MCAWLQTLAELSQPQREARKHAVMIVQKALCIQTGTQSVERFLGEVEMTERKNRQQHLTDHNLESSCQLNLQSLRGARLPKVFRPEELFESPHDSLQRERAPQAVHNKLIEVSTARTPCRRDPLSPKAGRTELQRNLDLDVCVRRLLSEQR